MKIDIVFLVILGFMVLRTICNNKTNIKEHMAVTDDMKAAIKELYTADVSAIQNLSDIATKLQTAGGLTIPGPLNITGALNVGATITGSALATGGNIWCTGTILAGPTQSIDIVARLLAAEEKITRLEATCQHMDTSANETIFKKDIKIAGAITVTNVRSLNYYVNTRLLYFADR